MPRLNPDSPRIGYVILASRKPTIEAFQAKAGYGERSEWTHVAGSIGGYNKVEAAVPKSRVFNLQKEYVSGGIEIKVMRRRSQIEHKRCKVALRWATMKNLPYAPLQFFWFPLSISALKSD